MYIILMSPPLLHNPSPTTAGEALLACRQTHATAGQCLQAARANAALAAARSDVLAQMQARAERNSNLPAVSVHVQAYMTVHKARPTSR